MVKNDHNLGLICGKYVDLREVSVSDAAFILELRLSEKARLLHATSPDLRQQEDYLRHYLTLDDEWYFIVQDKQGNPMGCLSIYDVRGNSVCTGRWVMKETANARYGIEGDMLLKQFAYETLGAEEIRMDTRLTNRSIRSFFEAWRCTVVGMDTEEVFVTLSKSQYEGRKAFVGRFCS